MMIALHTGMIVLHPVHLHPFCAWQHLGMQSMQAAKLMSFVTVSAFLNLPDYIRWHECPLQLSITEQPVV